MRTFQIVFQGGLTRNIAADFFRRFRQAVRFYANGQMVAEYPAGTLVRIDEVGLVGYAA